MKMVSKGAGASTGFFIFLFHFVFRNRVENRGHLFFESGVLQKQKDRLLLGNSLCIGGVVRRLPFFSFIFNFISNIFYDKRYVVTTRGQQPFDTSIKRKQNLSYLFTGFCAQKKKKSPKKNPPKNA